MDQDNAGVSSDIFSVNEYCKRVKFTAIKYAQNHSESIREHERSCPELASFCVLTFAKAVN